MSTIISQRAASIAYSTANSRGEGYAPYTDVPGGEDTVDAALAAFAADGWEVVLSAGGRGEVTVLRDADGELVALGGDSMGYGAWACPIAAGVQS